MKRMNWSGKLNEIKRNENEKKLEGIMKTTVVAFIEELVYISFIEEIGDCRG